MMRDTSPLSRRPARETRALALIAALSVVLMVGVFAIACGGGSDGTTSTTPPTASTPTTLGGIGVVVKNLGFSRLR